MATQNSGINRLARVLRAEMKRTGKQVKTLDFGTIGSDRSLKTNSFSVPIPAGDYLVCRGAAQNSAGLQTGDRVMVAWVGADAVVIDVIMQGDEVS